MIPYHPGVVDEFNHRQVTPSVKDWPESGSGNPGNYMSRCCLCNTLFLGYAHRSLCQECALK